MCLLSSFGDFLVERHSECYLSYTINLDIDGLRLQILQRQYISMTKKDTVLTRLISGVSFSVERIQNLRTVLKVTYSRHQKEVTVTLLFSEVVRRSLSLQCPLINSKIVVRDCEVADFYSGKVRIYGP